MEEKGLTPAIRTFHQREAWVAGIFTWVKKIIANYGDPKVSTCNSLCITSLKNSYVRGQVFPFINIPIRCGEKELLGLYEYFGEQMPLSDKNIYCDFVVHSIYYSENKDPAVMKIMEERARNIFKNKGYHILSFYDGMATITIDRSILENEQKFTYLLTSLLDEAIKMQAETA